MNGEIANIPASGTNRSNTAERRAISSKLITPNISVTQVSKEYLSLKVRIANKTAATKPVNNGSRNDCGQLFHCILGLGEFLGHYMGLAFLEAHLAEKAAAAGATSYKIIEASGNNQLHGTAVLYK